MCKYKIYVKRSDGKIEEVDSTDCESEAVYLVNEYRAVYGSTVARIWMAFG